MDGFSTKSVEIENIIQSFNLTKTLFVSSLIVGEANIGKKSLAKYILPNAKIVSARDIENISDILETTDEIIITDFEHIQNIDHINFTNKKIIATAQYISNQDDIKDYFSFIYDMPSLKERPLDVDILKSYFLEEACKSLDISCEDINIDHIENDLSNNSKSLKRSINSYIFKRNINNQDIEELIYHYILNTLEGNDGYKANISLFERPLIKAGLAKYKSQLKLAEVLGITRNTLRKKIHEHKIN